MDVALFLIILASVGAGVAGSLAATWGLRRRTYSLELEVAYVSGILQREVKARAAGERWRKKDELEERVEELVNLTTPGAPAQKVPFWQRFPRQEQP